MKKLLALFLAAMMVLGMASMVESRDNSTGGHIRRTSDVVTIFARKLMQSESEKHLGVTKKFLKDVAKAAPMHDLGKIAVDDKVLRKKGKYNAEEYAEMKKHGPLGWQRGKPRPHRAGDPDRGRGSGIRQDCGKRGSLSP